jgi:predicted LPLAT superfamily acyltransferase
MMRGAAAREEWATTRERGAVPLIRLMAWLTIRLGRSVALLLTLPVCAWFFLVSSKARAASKLYLARVLDRPPALSDRWRHFHSFAVCVLDRVMLLNDRLDLFRITVNGGELVSDVMARGEGCFLFGAHLGSFEVIRAVGRLSAHAKLTLVMYQDNARKTNAVLNAINPALALEIIGLGKPGSMLAIRDRLDDGHFVGILADRSLNGERTERLPFLGAEARFPVGPFRLASLLRRPVLLMDGVYRGDGLYDISFETLSDGTVAIEDMMRHYAAWLDRRCRSAPYNWFNFFDFWA